MQRDSITDIQAAAAGVERTLLMIPGPTAITPEVLAAGARPVLSHSDPRMRGFVAESLARLRTLFDAPASQPIVCSGSGTLALEIALANLVEPDDRVLILESGVFGGRFRTIAERNGAEMRVESAALGRAIDVDQVERALESFRPKVVTITHVDTSTGVRLEVEPLSRVAREHGALVVVDGVCSIGGEEFHGDAWGVDVGLDRIPESHRCAARSRDCHRRAASPGDAREPPHALPRVFHRLPELAACRWRATKAARPATSARRQSRCSPCCTPPWRSSRANQCLSGWLATPGSAARSKRASPRSDSTNVAAADVNANTLTVVRNPDGIGDELVDAVRAEGVTIARPIHPELRGRSFRVGHMGICGPAEILTTLGAIERALYRLGEPVDLGASLAAAQQALARGPVVSAATGAGGRRG